jgi:hypothetical protein
MEYTFTGVKIQLPINSQSGFLQYVKMGITLLICFAAFSFTSCKTCKCPAYSYHHSANKISEAPSTDLLHNNYYSQAGDLKK